MRFLNEIKLLDHLPDASMSAQRESSTVIFNLQKFASESKVIETRRSKNLGTRFDRFSTARRQCR